MLQFLKKTKTKTIHKIAYRNSTISILIKSVGFTSPSSTKEYFTKEGHIDGSLVKSITLSENTPVKLIAFFLSDSNIWYCFMYFVMTLIAAAFHVQIFFNCSNFFWWMSKWYLSFVPSLKWDSASQMEIMKQCIHQNNLFQQMIMLQYWVYWLILILIQSHHTWPGHIFNIAELYPFFLLSYLNSDVFSEFYLEHLRIEI